jgi:predicted DNA-binding transcriptional regulator AlpA
MCDSSLSEALTRQFYAWEMRGRGWVVFPQPITLEPPFRPFFGHYAAPSAGVSYDDGKKPTVLSSLFERLKSRRMNEPPSFLFPDEQEPEPEFSECRAPISELQIALPPEMKTTKEAADQFLLSTGHLSRPLSFELVGTSDSVVVQIACATADRLPVREQLHAYFPAATVSDSHEFLSSLWEESSKCERAIVDFGLAREFMRPLRVYDRFEPDPLAGLIAALGELAAGEIAVLQVLFSPVRCPWAENIMRAVTDEEGSSFFLDDPVIVKAASAKISSPLFAVVLRVAAQSPRAQRAWRIARQVGQALRQFGQPVSNELVPLSNDDYQDEQHDADILTRESCRSGMLLNCEELLSIVHPPSASVRSPKLKREQVRSKPAPSLAFGHELVLGDNRHAGATVTVTLGPDQRARHMHLIGASGSGKSTLLLNMVLQDITHGEGLVVLDPHGDLIDHILERMPQERIPDVVLFDPADEAYPIGFNILSAHSDLERNLLASDLVSVFRRLSTSFGDQMNTVLANAILAFLENSRAGTLVEVRRFLIEPAFRENILATVRDPEIAYYWRKEFPLLTGKPQGPILTRLDTFLRPRIIRNMVGQKENRIDFADLMNSRKILLAKLAQGLIGEENSYLLGTLLVSKLNQTAMSRQSLSASERNPFYVYVDEFHNFVTPSMAAILAGARKYQVGLILAHQQLQQISNRDADVAGALIANPYTRVCFRLGDHDAKKFEEGFSFFTARDLQNLGIGEAICRIERAENDFNLRTVPVPPAEPTAAARRRAAIVDMTRERYARRREELETSDQPNQGDGEARPAVSKPKGRIRLRVPLPGEEKEKGEQRRTVPENDPGRGGDHHKYLQRLLQRWAEGRGYRVTLEKPVLDGLGIIDAVLEKKGCPAIACEISITTPTEHELRNAEKCLAAGFERVVMVAPDETTLNRVRSRVSEVVSAKQLRKIRFVLPEQIFDLVSAWEAERTQPDGPGEPSKELLTAKEVEELLRIDVKTIYNYVQRGLIPYVRIQSNLRFIKSEVLAWVVEHQSAGRSPTKRK